MNDQLQDARNAGECANLRLSLQIHDTAIELLIHDLSERSEECKLEKHFDFLKARRHRQAIDEAIRRYHRMTCAIPLNRSPNSSRQRVRSLIEELVAELRLILPSIDPADLAEASDPDVDWRVRLKRCAVFINRIVRKLDKVRGQLTKVLLEKSKISEQIQMSLGRMSDIV